MKKLYEFTKNRLLSSLEMELNRVHGFSQVPKLKSETVTETGAVIEYEAQYADKICITAEFGEESILFSADIRIHFENGFYFGFASEKAVSFTLGDSVPEKIVATHHSNPWWMYPEFCSDFTQIPKRTEQLLLKEGELSYHLLPLCGDNFRAEFCEGKLYLTSDMTGLYTLTGPFLSISVSTDPLAAVEANYRGTRALGGIRVPLRSERTMPEHFGKFGWCTWDTFYNQVTSEKIFSKLDEFKEKNIPVKWMIIDDGWLSVKNRKLTAFEPDPEKFPDGLSSVIAKIKKDYGVEKVGVWHAFNGYWDGVDPESGIGREYADCLTKTNAGFTVPSLDEDKAFRFWDAWHSYLASCGIDFLKVDNQSSNAVYLEGIVPNVQACRVAHAAMDRSIVKNFGGAVINCMGMSMESVFARPYTGVSRNSDDFFPMAKRGFVKHLIQNAYNAIWHNQIYYCDFDMWWSTHENAVQSAVLRSIGGTPIYVSDKLGNSDAETILSCIESDGTVMMCDYAARPTKDSVYTDSVVEKKFVKIWNRAGDSFALAAFNVTPEEVTDTVDFGGIPEMPDGTEYVAYEYFSKKYIRINCCSDLTLTLPADGVAVWSIYPIVHPDEGSDEGAYFLCGNTDKYVPIASKYRVKIPLDRVL